MHNLVQRRIATQINLEEGLWRYTSFGLGNTSVLFNTLFKHSFWKQKAGRSSPLKTLRQSGAVNVLGDRIRIKIPICFGELHASLLLNTACWYCQSRVLSTSCQLAPLRLRTSIRWCWVWTPARAFIKGMRPWWNCWLPCLRPSEPWFFPLSELVYSLFVCSGSCPTSYQDSQ